jgi:3-oxoacyl-[acyl-carrier-protein] synthase-3
MQNHVGIVGIGIYLPKDRKSAKELSNKTNGVWSEEAIIDKLGIVELIVPGENDGAQQMGVWAAKDALQDAKIDASEIDCVLCITEEWKEYPLTTSANYVIREIGAENAWGIDIQNRCCTSVTAIKIGKDLLLSDDSINTVLIAGGYRNSDLIDYTDRELSMMFDLAAGGGAIILKKNAGKNLVLGSHIKSDGTLAHAAGARVGGTKEPLTKENMKEYFMIRILEPDTMKARLKEVSITNWIECINQAFKKSDVEKRIDYLAILHFKRSAHKAFLEMNQLKEEQSIYLEEYGHLGQIDPILSLYLARKEGRIKKGDNVVMLAAGIGYTWAASVIRWGNVEREKDEFIYA